MIVEKLGRYCELNGLDEIQDLENGMDFRLPQYRREVFLRFYEFHLKYRSHPGGVYYLMPFLAEKLKFSAEDRLWYSFINGCTQHPLTSYLIFRAFPDPHSLNLETLEAWFNDHWKRLGWDMDRRYQKKDFPQCAAWYASEVAGNQESYFRSLYSVDDSAEEKFQAVWKNVYGKFPSFGRLSTFSYLEYLRIMGASFNCDDLFLDDKNGSKSHRNGLVIILGRDDLDWRKNGFDGFYNADQIGWLKKEANQLLEDAKERFSEHDFKRDVSFFSLESTLCCYKSWHRPNRRYPNVYNDMLHDRIRKTEEAWPNENFSLFWEARKATLPAHLRLEENPNDVGLRSEKQNHYLETGQVIMMEKEWPCFKNDYSKRLGSFAAKVITKKASICGRWTMEFLDEPDAETENQQTKKSYLQIIKQERKRVSSNTFAKTAILDRLPKGLRVAELFGGVGIQATYIQHELQPAEHIIVEQNTQCIAHLQRVSKATLIQGEAQEIGPTLQADLYILDWNTWTIRHYNEWELLFSAIFAQNPLAVSFSDSSAKYFHLHRKLYSRLLGNNVKTLEDYCHNISKYFDRLHGYRISRAIYSPAQCIYFLFSQNSEFSELESVQGEGFEWM